MNSKTLHLKLVGLLACQLLFSNVFSQGYRWGSVAIGGGGFVSSIITSKTERNLIYARTDVGGAYRWNSINSTWIPLNDWASVNETGYLGAESFAIDPQAPNKFYMLVGISYFNSGRTAVLRSTDYGNTFQITDVSAQFKAHGNGMGRQTGEKLQVDPNNGNILYCGSRANGLFKSTNAGASFTRLSGLNVTSTPNGNGVSVVFVDPSSGTPGSASSTVYVGISRAASPNLFISRDGGNTFEALAGAPNAGFMPQRITMSREGIMYINYANGAGPNGSTSEAMNNGAIHKFNTKTGAWSNVTPSGISRAWGGICVDPANSNRVIASTINNYQQQGNQGYGDRIYLSTNGGSSWTDIIARGHTLNTNGCTWISGHAIHWAGSVEFDPFDTKKAMITSGNGIFINDNVDVASTAWRFDVKGLEETVPLDFVSIPNGPAFSVIGDYDGFKHSGDINQYAPIHNPRMGTSSGIAYAALLPTKLVRTGARIYVSTNQGTSWTQATTSGTQGKVAISANGNTILHSPSAGTTYRSTNDGSSWSAVSGLTFTGAFPKADPVNSSKFYAFNNGTMYVSTDGGASFSAGGSTGSGGSRRIEVVPGREGHLWVALSNGVSRSTNSGASFTKLPGVTSAASIGVGKAAPGSSYHTIYIWGTVNGATGIHRSINEGMTWTRINDDAHEFGGPGNGQFVIGDQNVYGRVYMSTAGRGVAYGEIGNPTAVEDESVSADENFANVVCYPNPFDNDITIYTHGTFSYSIADITGRVVENGNGQNSLTTGSSLSAGMYFVTIEYKGLSKVYKVQKK